MSLKKTVIWAVETIRKRKGLEFVRKNVLVGTRLTDNPLQGYEIRVYATSKEEPREGRTIDSRSNTAVTSNSTPFKGEKTAVYQLNVEVMSYKEDAEKRLLGSQTEVGLYDLVELVQDALEDEWDFGRSIIAVEFGAVRYDELPLPPKAVIPVIVEESINVRDRLAKRTEVG